MCINIGVCEQILLLNSTVRRALSGLRLCLLAPSLSPDVRLAASRNYLELDEIAKNTLTIVLLRRNMLNWLILAGGRCASRPAGPRAKDAVHEQHVSMVCYAMLCYAILHYTILHHTILYYAILYYTIPYYTMEPRAKDAVHEQHVGRGEGGEADEGHLQGGGLRRLPALGQQGERERTFIYIYIYIYI